MKLLHQVIHHQHMVKVLIVIDQQKEQLFQLEQILIDMVYNKVYLIKIEQQLQQHEQQDVLVMEIQVNNNNNNKQELVLLEKNKKLFLIYQKLMKNFCKVKFTFHENIKVKEATTLFSEIC